MKTRKLNKLIGFLLFKLKFRYYCSSDIVGNITYGYGKLDYLGYWQFPVNISPQKQ